MVWRYLISGVVACADLISANSHANSVNKKVMNVKLLILELARVLSVFLPSLQFGLFAVVVAGSQVRAAILGGVNLAKFVIPEAVHRDEKVPREESAHPEQVKDEIDGVEPVPRRGIVGLLRYQEICKNKKCQI